MSNKTGRLAIGASADTEPPRHADGAVPPLAPWTRRLLIGIVAVYAALCLIYSTITPIGEACDELDHVRYVEHLLRFGDFASISAGGSQMPYTLEAKQPPAYYLLNAGLMLGMGRCGRQLAPELVRNPNGPSFGPGYSEVLWFLHPPVPYDLQPWTYLMRLLSTVLGAGTILLVFATAREVLPARDYEPLALCAAATTALLPTFTFVSSTVNNDNLATLAGSGFCYCLTRLVRRGTSLVGAVCLGLLAGLALLSKMNTLGLVATGFLLLLVNPVVRKVRSIGPGAPTRLTGLQGLRQQTGPRLLAVTLAVLAASLAAGWWYVRNLLVYGDLFAVGAVNQMAAAVLAPAYSVAPGPQDSLWLLQLFMVTGTHYGAFGCVTVKAPLLLWLIYMALLAMAALGIVISLVRRILTRTQVMQIMIGMLSVILIYGTMIRSAVGQGRLLFPAVAFTSLLIAMGTYGLLSFVARRRSIHANAVATAVLWTSFLGITNVYCLFFVLIPAWYP